MKKSILLMLLLSSILSIAYAESIIFNDSTSGSDSAPTVVSITTSGLPDGAVITSTQITLTFGTLSYVGNWYDADIIVNGTDYTEVGWLDNAVYNDLNDLGPNGLVVTATSVDSDSYSDNITLSLSVEIFYTPPAGTPDPASNPNPAENALDVALNGNLTWNFGVDTEAYDLWFGPTGSMTQVVDGVSAALSGSYAYSDLSNDTQYSWRVDTINISSGVTTSGTEWSFRTILPEGLVQIGSGTTDLDLPLNTYYGYNYSQMLYLQSEIGVANKRIEKLYVNWNGYETGEDYKDWTIYLGHTDKSSFANSSDWVSVANMSQVFSGEITIPATTGWIEILLDTPFAYNNTDNLVVAINETTSGYGSSSAYFYNTGFATNRGLRLRNDSSAYNPASPGAGTLVAGVANIRMLFGDMPIEPLFAYSPTTLLFPTTKVGELSVTQNVTISNTGGGTLYYSDLSFSISGNNPTDFSYDTSNLQDLETGQSFTLPVSFNPQSDGQLTANLVISYAGDDYVVDLSGYAYPTTYLIEDFEGSAFPPTGWANPGSWGTSTYTYYTGTKAAYKSGSSSTQYILSTPKLYLSDGGTLSFMARITSTTSPLDIVYSTDRVTWTKLGESILAESANSWFHVIANLSEVSAKTTNFYLGFRTMTYSSYYIDEVIMPPLAQEAPDAVTLTTPTNASSNVSIMPTLSWTPSSLGGIASSYDIYLEATDSPEDPDADPHTLLTNVTTTSYTLETVLDYSTSYIWKVVAKNSYGESENNVVFNFSTIADPTVYVTAENPWLVDFGTSSDDWPVANWSQISGVYPIPNGTLSRWIQDDWLNATSPVNKSAKINIYGTTCYYWLLSPPINIPTTGYELKFDLGLTDYANSNPIEDPTSQLDDKFIVAMSNNPNMSNPVLLREWNNSGSDDVFNEIPNTGTTITIPLTEISGTIYFAFYGESTLSNGDNDLFVDNVIVRVPPTTPTFSISPESMDYGLVNLSQNKAKVFTITNTGVGTLMIDNADVTITGDNTDQFTLSPIAENISLDAGQSTEITITFSPTSEGEKSAILNIVDNIAATKIGQKSGAKLSHQIMLTGEGYDANISSFPWREGFEDAFPPLDWANSNWEWSSYGGAHTGSEFAYSNLSGSLLTTPPIAVPATGEYQFEFWYRAESTSYPQDMNVYINIDGENVVEPIITIEDAANTTYQKAVFSLLPYVGNTVIFTLNGLYGSGGYSYGICVDDVGVVEAFDYPADEPVTIGDGENTIVVTVSNGSANNDPEGEIPPINNSAFTPTNSFVLQLIGSGPWTVTIETDAPWGAYYRSGHWHAEEAIEGIVTFNVEPSKDINMPIILGDQNPTLPVTLASFSAVLTSDLNVKISWMAESEVNHSGYNILRNEIDDLDTAMLVNDELFRDGIQTGTQVKYTYTDTEVYLNATYYYWLESISLNGVSEYFGPLNVLINSGSEEPDAPQIPLETALMTAYPNPFNPSTNIRYSMKIAGDVRIDIFNVKGQLMRSFSHHHNLPGYYSVTWDGRDDKNNTVGTGLYFYRMTSDQYRATKKMVLSK
ncbi:MAG: choice-of-anchor D domain-containing protein [Candidatus Cloacimonetes bacterium]|nr:choice-of-anchor D domain-containing protein [Candidatus Cloacimonadota bacterium]